MPPVTDILRTLIGFRSICGTPNADIIAWIEGFLHDTGCRVTVVPGDRPDAQGLYASVGPDAPGGIVLSAHCDVVPVAGQNWTTDPFTLTRQGDRLYGRGTSDMKGFLACMLRAAEIAATTELRRPLHLAVSYDEELGCLGVRSLLRALKSRGLDAAGAVIGEPTGMRVALAHKGKIAFKIVCSGLAAHSANPLKGHNAIALGAHMVGLLGTLQQHITRTERHDPRFEVPFSTVQAGLIRGGTALNIVPDHCEIDAEMRLIPGQDGTRYLAWLNDAAQTATKAIGGGDIRIDVTNAYPGLDADTGSAIADLAFNLTGRNDPTVVDFGTEAGLFTEQLGLPAVVCGPGSIARAHKPDEYITIDELHDGERFVARIVDQLAR